ncbi:unnamed protein product [Dimorphilus gyrociliatus]|uniref:Uncharacterized protein n=1 Tax=Dimorphilus gyrociliatus TaxID=2664684 RepID=A0A7I8VB32_9ANNE|nr:unnamed protein product [Dimorphilus gyrociliatus]
MSETPDVIGNLPNAKEIQANSKRSSFGAEKKMSVCLTMGNEGKTVEKGAHIGKSIAVFTSGGDAQGY